MKLVKTDNSYFEDKVIMRLKHLPEVEKIRVLDAFGGEGRVWNKVRELSGRNIQTMRIDRKADRKGTYLKGDNIKYLASMDFSKFDVIDLDAYGVPFEQLEYLFKAARENKISAYVFVTFIQTAYGRLPYSLLRALGYSDAMFKKIPSLFNKDGFVKFQKYLSYQGLTEIYVRSKGGKYYIFFKIENSQ